MTKLEMARRITKQLFVMDDIPPADHHHVRRLARCTKARLEELTQDAKRAAEARLRGSARLMYDSRKGDARKLLAMLSDAIDAHATEQSRDSTNWGFTGDLGRVRDDLVNLVASITGQTDDLTGIRAQLSMD